MFGAIVFFVGFILGFPIAHYTSYLINNCEDCEKQVVFKFVSIRSILICAIGGLLWLVVYIFDGISILSLVYMVVSSILLAISVVDFAVNEIPPQFNIALACLGLICLGSDLSHWYNYLIGAAAVSGIFLLMALATKGQGMGGGDIKLMAATGFMLGWQKILFVMVIGSVLGIIIHGTMMVILKKKHMLAFGPYLSMGVYIMMIWGSLVVDWYVNTFFNFYG